jgi:hypothetical protein
MKQFAVLFSGFLLAANGAAQSSAPPKSDPPLATVDGQKLTEEDLARYVQSQLRPLREQEYQIKKKALDPLINQKLVDAEAKKKGLTTEKLYQQEVDAKVPESTDIELNAIYAVQKDQLNRPFEEVNAAERQHKARGSS